MSEEPKPSSIFERHAQTVIGAILLAILLWTGNALIDVRDRLGRIEVYQMNAAGRDAMSDTAINELRNKLDAAGMQLAEQSKQLNALLNRPPSDEQSPQPKTR